MTFAHSIGAVAVATMLLLSGCASASGTNGPTPTVTAQVPTTAPEEALPPIDEADFDLVVTREIEGDAGPVTCTVYMRAEPASANGDVSDAEAASQFLASYDASSIVVSLDEYDPEDIRKRRAQGVTDSQLLFMLVTDRIHQDFTDAGMLTMDVSLAAETRCL